MNTSIYYFSGTGNSLKIATLLSEKLQHCELIPIAKIWLNDPIISNSENIGIIFPLYFWGLPAIVYNFITKLDLSSANYTFAVITSGGGRTGAALRQLDTLLNKKHKQLNAGFSVKMPGNYILMYDVPSVEKQKELFKNSADKLERIAERISNKKDRERKEILAFIGNIGNKLFRKKVYNSDINFYADEKCNSCEICEKICPVNNIKIIDGRPQWQHKCQQCLACLHFCPQFAIQYGKKTIGRKRYHHPEITYKDIENQKYN
ncbi:MAG: 4Fe-4S ferredoxin [Promethearchaeota archaeon]|nr:MAG: 4Fe-4S ferredoxin [Candidatus Lokiarchaeota archaeon]